MHKEQNKSTTKTLLHKTLQTFNNLPVEGKSESNINQFRRLLRELCEIKLEMNYGLRGWRVKEVEWNEQKWPEGKENVMRVMTWKQQVRVKIGETEKENVQLLLR